MRRYCVHTFYELSVIFSLRPKTLTTSAINQYWQMLIVRQTAALHYRNNYNTIFTLHY